MALFTKRCFFIVLLLAVSSIRTEESAADDEVTVEVEEEDLYHSPQINPNTVYLTEHFDDEAAFNKKWVKSEAKKKGVDENIAKYDGKWEIQAPARRILKNDLGLVLTTEAKHAAISALLDKPFEFKDKPLIVQYEVTMQEGQNCGGAYLKLLSKGTNTKSDLRKFYDQTPYTIMFGPDKCGNDNKLHFIFRHRNPKNGSFEEKHSKKPTKRLEDIYKDKEPHLYTLIVRPDNTFTVLVDNKEANSGSLLEDFTPPVNPPKEIDDPKDSKPADWDEREKIVDPTATKPADWDEQAPAQIADPNAVKPDGWLDNEPEMVPDPDAQKPLDWDEEMDGSWEAPLVDNPACAVAPGCGAWRPPLIPNPEYKGVWRAPLITNPNYRGKWTPRRIANPDYFKDDHPFKMTPITAVGFELWSMSPMLLFDNLIITDELATAEEWASQTYALKRAKISSDEESLVERLLRFAGENPVLYVAIIISSFLVVGFVAFFCFGPKTTDPAADAKKTDSVTEDYVPEEQKKRRSKASLEGPEPAGGEDTASDTETEQDVDTEREPEAEAEPEREPEDEPEGEQEPEPEFERAPEHDSDPEPVSDSTSETPLLDTAGGGDGQRRRKPRKE